MLDETLWKTIGGKKFCAFKKKANDDYLCRNKNNVTGLCNAFSCPLANTKYATVRCEEEELYLYVKEPERIHTPNEQFEKIKLSKNYEEGLKQIEKELEFFDAKLIHKCKQRHTKLTEYLERLEYFKEHGRKEFMVRKRKMNKREKLAALQCLEDLDFEKEIGEELMLRLESGVYGEEMKDKYHKAHEKYLQEKAKEGKKKKYVAMYEDSDSHEKEESKETEDTKTKKKTKKEQLTW
ncbi:Protein mak16 [Nosema granulosis]|uniref:Protein MAK16 n=1 Tax=Nosema granulosis TaxID=83296 RepID=A0A9P6KZG3_9MICR|nr:Protein mak16 [Nosema granulosis]